MKKQKKEDHAGALVPAGLFIGMGIGFLVNELVAGLFIGLGAGLGAMALLKAFQRK